MLSFKYNKKTNNIKIIDSYLVTDKKRMIEYLDQLPLEKVNRSFKSCLNEWIAHNRLYNLGLFKNHTSDCDLTQDESLFRRACYWILSRCYK